MSISRRVFALAIIALWGLGMTGSAHAYTGQKYSSQAKITIGQARNIAQQIVPGKIVKEELEKEKGGSGLRYSFDIEKNGVRHEVGIDASSGKILENNVESKQMERQEKD